MAAACPLSAGGCLFTAARVANGTCQTADRVGVRQLREGPVNTRSSEWSEQSFSDHDIMLLGRV